MASELNGLSLHADTNLVRGGIDRTGFDETSEAMFLTSGYVYGSAAEAEAAFAGDVDHYIYSRYGNPTVAAFEERLRLLEGSEGVQATGSGMAAVFNALIACLSAGDRIVASRSLFGSCFVILDELLPRWGITTDFVDGSDLAQWEQALATPAAVVFFESPSNPMQQLIDIEAVAALGHAAGATIIVDNVFATPLYQKPIELGADVVVYSTTKHLDGQGRTLGGAVCATEDFLHNKLQPFIRHTGPSMSPFNAWVLTKALETLSLRVDRMSETAEVIAQQLESVPGVSRVLYPGLESHPQFDLAKRQMTCGGTVVTFELVGGKPAAFSFLDALQIIDISNNLGDAKTLTTHPASTTHRRLGPEVRKQMGITDGIVRISVGLEHRDDLLADISRGLNA